MLPDLPKLRDRFVAYLEGLVSQRRTRIILAALATAAHLMMFARAGHVRLDIPFNSNPGERPYYSNIDAPAVQGYPRQPHHWSRLITARWDSQIYIGFAVRGLDACPKNNPPGSVGDFQYLQCGLGWLPAYGAIGGLISKVTTVPEDYSLMFIAVLCTVIINFLWTSTAISKRLGKLESFGALLAFNFFPTAFYMVAPYTESITLVLCLTGFVLLCSDRWFLASVAVGAATAFRATAAGFTLGLCFAAVYVAWRRRREKAEKWWWPLTAIPLSGWGMAMQMLVLKIMVGTAFAYLRARHAFGDYNDYSRLVDPEFLLRGFTAQHMDSVMLIGSIGIVALMGRELFRRLRAEELIYLFVAAVFCLVFSIAALHEYWGLNRYFLLCIPVFLCGGLMMRKHPVAFVLWLLLCAMIYWHVELCSYISHGNPQVCPCLGRFEFGMPFQS